MSASTSHNVPPRNPPRACRHLRSQFGETSEALFLTQGYVYDNSRAGRGALQGRGARLPVFALRQSDRRRCSSSAWRRSKAPRPRARPRPAWRRSTLALMGQVRAGDHVVAVQGAVRLLPLRRRGLPAALRRHLDAGRRHRSRRNGATRCGRTPRPSSSKARPIPTLEVLDIAAIAKIAHAAGATLVVDNVFSTPLWQSPLALGADCVVYSATKHIDGQGRCLGGVILGSEKFIQDNIHTCIRQTGPSMSPFNAWVHAQGAGDAGGARAAADRHRGDGRGRAGRASEDHRG